MGREKSPLSSVIAGAAEGGYVQFAVVCLNRLLPALRIGQAGLNGVPSGAKALLILRT
jgi:hypothetical protein